MCKTWVLIKGGVNPSCSSHLDVVVEAGESRFALCKLCQILPLCSLCLFWRPQLFQPWQNLCYVHVQLFATGVSCLCFMLARCSLTRFLVFCWSVQHIVIHISCMVACRLCFVWCKCQCDISCTCEKWCCGLYIPF